MTRIYAGLLLILPALAAAQDYKIVYASPKGIFAMNSGGGGVKRLTEDPAAIISDSAWSPDGQKIMFFTFRKTDAALEYNYNLPFHFPLYVMNADGTNQKRLLDVPVIPDAKWSPDGKRILFTSSYEGDSRTRGIYVVDVATGTKKRLTEPGFNQTPSWSPDGTKIVFSAGVRPREIYVMNADGSNRVQLTKLGIVTGNPTWSPDGRRIAFVGAGWWLMDANGANAQRISSIGGPSSLMWSPDSKHILVTGQGSGYIWHADGSKSTALPRKEYTRILDAAFSPDGRKALYRGHEGMNDKIYVVNIDGKDWRTISESIGEHALFAVSRH